jgi:hypothetical protein
MKKIIGVILMMATLMACSSRQAVTKEYHEDLRTHGEIEGQPTVILFLIDGLSVSALSDALSDDRVSTIQRFFAAPNGNLVSGAAIPFARAAFPTLTYPNLVSILTLRPPSEHGIIGNNVLERSGEITDYASSSNWEKLDHQIADHSIFTHLKRHDQISVNYSYPFSEGAGTRVSEKENLEAGLDYLNQKYAEIDHDTIESLRTLLTQTRPSEWPRFIFVHLIGVDSLSHEFGPDDSHVKRYIAELDHELAPIFKSIERAERSGHAVATVLTSDHGFASIHHDLHVEDAIKYIQHEIRTVADGRVDGLYFPHRWSQHSRDRVVTELRKLEHVEWVIVHRDEHIYLYNSNGSEARIDMAHTGCASGHLAIQFQWLKVGSGLQASPIPEGFFCPESFDNGASFASISYIIPSLVDYFKGPVDTPDALLIADEHSEFSGKYRGNHGGLTPAEVLVPMLGRHTPLPGKVFPTWQLLHHLQLM